MVFINVTTIKLYYDERQVVIALQQKQKQDSIVEERRQLITKAQSYRDSVRIAAYQIQIQILRRALGLE